VKIWGENLGAEREAELAAMADEREAPGPANDTMLPLGKGNVAPTYMPLQGSSSLARS